MTGLCWRDQIVNKYKEIALRPFGRMQSVNLHLANNWTSRDAPLIAIVLHPIA